MSDPLQPTIAPVMMVEPVRSIEPARNEQARNIEEAMNKTVEVQRELEVASAELGLTHGALEREVPETVKQKSDVAWAIRQNAELERKVQQAAEDLEHVTELLEQARADA